MKTTKHLILKIVLIYILVVSFAVLFQSHKASAAGSYYLPDPTDFSAGSNVNLEISQQGSEISLNATSTWIKFLYNPAVTGTQVGVQVGHGFFRYCGANDPDSVGAGSAGCNPGDPDYDPGAVRYSVYYGDPATGGTTPDTSWAAAAVNSDDPLIDQSAYWSTIYNVPTSARAPINVGGGNMRYVLYLKAEWNSGPPSVGRINSFKGAVIVAGGLASYWTGNGNYAVQDRLSAPGTQGTFNFGFAPNCDAPSSQVATLSWTDADAAGLGGVPSDSNISFDLYEGDPGTTPSALILHIDEGTSPNIGGNNENRSVNFPAQKNKIYLWRWNDVERINGIQMAIPYDSSNYYIQCEKQPYGVIDGWDCNAIPGWAYDENSPNTAIGIHIYINNPAPGSPGDFYDYGATDQPSPDINNNAGIPNAPTAGNHRFRWNIPNKYKDGSPHRFYIYARGVDSAGNGGGSDGDANNPEITAYSNGASLGSFTCGGTIVGRAFYDDNGNTVMDPGERIVESPAGACGGSNVPVNGISVSAVSTGGTSNLDKCNTDGSIAPGQLASFKLTTPAGSQTVNLNLPPGWIPTNGSSRTFTVTDGATVSATKAQYFGVQIRPPTVVTKCLNSVSLADISWGPAVIPAASFFADIDDGPPTPSFSQYWNKGTGAATTTTAPGVPSSFNAFPTAGPALDFNAVPAGSPYSVRIYYNGPNVHTASASFVTKGCPKLTCGTLNAIPTQPEDSVTFNMTVSFNNIGAGDLNAGANLGVVFPGYYNNANTPYTNRPLLAGQTGISNPISLNVAAGIYVVTWTVTGDPASNELIDPNPPPSATCRQTLSVSRKPYFRVFGGDVIAGSNAVACPKWFPHTLTSFGSIQAFSNGSGNGAGTQLVAQALATINGFSSAQSRTTNPTPDKGLSFSNTNGDPTYGGSFLAGGCPPDFWSSKPPVVTSNTNNYTIPASALGAYLYQPSSGNLDLKSASDKLTNGTVLALYVDGNVTITRDIAAEFTSWGSVNDIPSLVVIAHGNIFIDKDVSTIDAVLVAQPVDAANGGYIYTCSIGNSLPSPSDIADPSGACKANPLTITGAVVARTVKLFRSSGSLKNSTNAEQPSGPTANAAERFVYSPEVWLRANGVRGTPTLGTYDAVTGLPPVF